MPKQRYIGVKMVEAEAMTAEAFNTLTNRMAKPGEDVNEVGYCVTYGPDGYQGWCPKETFEKANYPLAGEGNMLTKEDITNFLPEVGGIKTAKYGEKTLVAQATCLTGFEITASSACEDEHNYDEVVGGKDAMSCIESKLRAHLGFVLQWAVNGLK